MISLRILSKQTPRSLNLHLFLNLRRIQVGMIYCVPDCPKPGSEFYDEFEVYRRCVDLS